jgi:hypothetical protein
VPFVKSSRSHEPELPMNLAAGAEKPWLPELGSPCPRNSERAFIPGMPPPKDSLASFKSQIFILRRSLPALQASPVRGAPIP